MATTAAPSAVEILFENEEIMVVNKPAGLIVHSDGRTIEPSLAAWLAEVHPELQEIGEPWVSPQGERISLSGLVHRLDRSTSGVMVVAKNAIVYENIKQQFKSRTVEKVYWALVRGHVEDETGTISAEIVRTNDVPKRWVAKDRDPEHKRTALTHWKVLRRFQCEGKPVSLLEVRPRTGRTHQIRVHMKHIGHPIVGDRLYDTHARDFTFERPLLHAWALTIELSGTMRQWFAPAPDDMQGAFGE